MQPHPPRTPAPTATRPDAPPLPVRADRQRPGPAARTTGLILGPVETAPRCARGVLAAALAQWGLLYLREPGEEVVSELVTNAIAASRSAAPPGTEPRPVTVTITAAGAELIIRVWDPDPAPPPADPSLPAGLAESGRGLFIVAALSSRWSWHPAPNGGKYTWAALPLNPGPHAA
jgi:anti-sigma regulatory factor (Ser/Thr protein kinase)